MQIAEVFQAIERDSGGLDFLLHGPGCARGEELSRRSETSRERSASRSTSARTPGVRPVARRTRAPDGAEAALGSSR